jgi:hypothetical protein
MTTEEVLNTKQAMEYLGMGEMHLKNLCRQGKIENLGKQPVNGTKTLGWKFTKAQLDAYKATARTGVGKRADGRNKYAGHFSTEELAAVQEFLKSKKFLELQRANQPKAKTPKAEK